MTTVIVIGALAGYDISATFNTYKMPQTGTIPTTTGLTISINGVSWTNGTSIDWGSNLAPGQTYTKSITLTNTGTTAITTITLASDPTTPLPSGWTETISALTGTLLPSQVASGGLITLTIPSTATGGSYSWNSIITTT